VLLSVVAPRAYAQCPAWVMPFSPAPNFGLPYALATIPGGDVMVGGNFAPAGIEWAAIVRYHPASDTWSPVGGLDRDNFVGAPVVLAITALPGGGVAVGGSFYKVWGQYYFGVGRYSPSENTWSRMGAGISGPYGPYVTAMDVLPDGDVVAGGWFDLADFQTANSVARYNRDSDTWSPMGSGLTYDLNQPSGVALVMAIAVLSNGDIIVGGEFDTAGGQPANNIARWSPATNTWSSLGAGVRASGSNNGGAAQSLAALPGGDVLVGGDFALAGEVQAPGLARYSPSTDTWSAVAREDGVLANMQISVMARLPSGDVILSGVIDAYQDMHFARYILASNTWAELEPAIHASPYSLAVLPGGDVLLGGVLTAPTGSAAGGVARYSFGGVCCGSPDFNCDGDIGTDADIEAFFGCLAGNCPAPPCANGADFNGDGDLGTDADIEAFFRVLGGGAC
jgi:hypothetical protein